MSYHEGSNWQAKKEDKKEPLYTDKKNGPQPDLRKKFIEEFQYDLNHERYWNWFMKELGVAPIQQQPSSPLPQQITDKNFVVRMKAAVDKAFNESKMKDIAVMGAKHYEDFEKKEAAFFRKIEELLTEHRPQLSGVVTASITADEGAPKDALIELAKAGIAYQQAKSRLEDFFHSNTTSVEVDGKVQTVLLPADFYKVYDLILKEAFSGLKQLSGVQERDAVGLNELCASLDDKRIVQMMQALDAKEPPLFAGIPSRQHEDIFYLYRKQAAEHLMENYSITKRRKEQEGK